MKVKRLLALLLAAVLALSGTGCAQTGSSSLPVSSAASAAQSAADPADWRPYDENYNTLRTDRDATGTKGVVCTSNYNASRVGIEVMEAGGNAIDAAVAASFALGVAEPLTSGLGGGGFMLIHLASGEDIFLDYRETAPAAATPEMYTVNDAGVVANNEKARGGKSVAVPGEVAGMLYALENYGTLSRQEALAPAIALATDGYQMTPTFHTSITDNYDMMVKYTALGELFLDPNTAMPADVGGTLTNPDLAHSLQLIADGGRDAFYTGEMAQAFVDAVAAEGGILTMDDMAGYQVELRTPVTGTYRGYQVISSPPASSGGTHLIEILNILENFDLSSMEINSADYLHLFSESFKLAFADRSAYMADPDYVPDVPLAGLTSKEYAAELAAKIDPSASGTYSAGDPYKYQSGSTTHFSIADAEGNIVSCTQTINHFFGSGVAIPGYGFIANDEMDDFDLGTESVNRIEDGKRPLSSMSPTILLNADGSPFMVVGTPGATRIFTTTAQVISLVIDHGMDVQDAINTPRVFDSDLNTLDYESGTNGISPEVTDKLAAMGHKVNDKGEWNNYFGGVQAIVYGTDGTLRGGADPRRDGKAFAF